MAFVTLLSAEPNPNQWLNMSVPDLEKEIEHIKDENLKITLPFGIGMHHAGLQPSERSTVERLFVEKKIQVLVATATLAWGINCPAHLVIVKGTEYFDGAQHKYVDFPVTDVLQMIGRAGRPQFDDSAVAVVYVQDVKKNFYKRFLYEPFPVESSLLPALPNHVNAEVSAGTVASKQQIIEYISGTYFYRRLFANPTYYGVENPTPEGMTKFLTQVVDDCIDELTTSSCINVEDAAGDISPTVYGRICSNYYLEHLTIRHFIEKLQSGLNVKELLKILADCPEYAVIPVRHNEESIQESLNRILPIPLPKSTEFDSPHVKVFLLYQAHFTQFNGLSADYITDLRSIIDACIRILQAMLDICITNGWLDSSISTVILLQQIIQGRWYWDHPLMALPALIDHSVDGIGPYLTIPQLQAQYDIDKKDRKLNHQEITKITKEITSCTILDEKEAKQIVEALCHWPILTIKSSTMQNGLKECPINLDNLNAQPIQLEPFKRYKLRLKIQMLGPNKVTFAPRFHKEKTASWIILIGNKETNKIHGFTKCSPIEGSRDLRINFTSPSMPGNYTLTVFILSDSYLGIDQEYAIRCKVQN
uniref:Helicase C-terminal domain-containing protein n=1 Tax=Panagrolaimus davidi TaxID=227884 RepID=A0A914P3C1_9BILA